MINTISLDKPSRVEFHVTVPLNNMWTTCIFRYRQSNVWWLLPASNYFASDCAQWFDLITTSLAGGAAKHLNDGFEKHICRSSFEFRVCILLKANYGRFFSDFLYTGKIPFICNEKIPCHETLKCKSQRNRLTPFHSIHYPLPDVRTPT